MGFNRLMRAASPHCGQAKDVAVIGGNDCTKLIMQISPAHKTRNCLFLPTVEAKSRGGSALA
jgi:hypothetical protein